MGTAHGGTEIYRLERLFDPDFRPPARLLEPRDLDADPRPEDFRPPELRPPDFRAPPFLAPDRLDFLAAAFRPPDDDFRPDFRPPDDLEELREAFFLLPPLDLRLLELPDPLDPVEDRLLAPDVLPVRADDPVEPDEPALLPNELGRAPPEVPPPRPDAVPEDDEPPPNPELPELDPVPPPLKTLEAPPPLPPPVSEDSCFLPEPFGRPRLPLGAPPPKRSSSSSSSSSSPSATTVASVSVSSSSSESSALSQRRSL